MMRVADDVGVDDDMNERAQVEIREVARCNITEDVHVPGDREHT
jgi:hypothetical protein